MITNPLDRLAASYPSLSRVSPPLAARLAASCRAFTAASGAVVFDRGAPCAGLPLVLGGTVRISRPLANGTDVPLYHVGPGELCVLSMHALFSRVPHVASATALDEVDGLFVPGDLVVALVDDDAAFRHEALSALAARAGMLAALVEQVAAVRLDERVARLLTERGPVLAVTHQALAQELGTAREVVSRILESFESRGAVRLRRGRVEVLDHTRLAPGPRQTPRRAAPRELQEPQPIAG